MSDGIVVVPKGYQFVSDDARGARNVVFLLHMHQPQYVDPRSGRAMLPWVRLHGARGYLDVASLLHGVRQRAS